MYLICGIWDVSLIWGFGVWFGDIHLTGFGRKSIAKKQWKKKKLTGTKDLTLVPIIPPGTKGTGFVVPVKKPGLKGFPIEILKGFSSSGVFRSYPGVDIYCILYKRSMRDSAGVHNSAFTLVWISLYCWTKGTTMCVTKISSSKGWAEINKKNTCRLIS